MATKNKHMERSHRSYHKNVDFSDFERKANIKQVKKASQKSSAGLLGKLKQTFHRMTNK